MSLLPTAAKGEEDKRVDKKELDDINDHTAEGNLNWTQVWIYAEDVNQLQEAGH
jgi:hypothetical protein